MGSKQNKPEVTPKEEALVTSNGDAETVISQEADNKMKANETDLGNGTTLVSN